jgi:hypothetical protein
LINKVGAKEGVTATNTIVVAVNAADNATLYDDEDDCLACKL